MLVIKSEVRPSPIHGLGCFTLQNVAKGELVWQFHPEVDRRYRLEELARLPAVVLRHFGTYAWINPADQLVLFCGDQSQFFNHSDQANTTMTSDGYCCVAERDIAAGEELTSDYSQLQDLPDVANRGQAPS